MFDDLLTIRVPPPNRVGTCEGSLEHHLSEGAVMLAFAMHLFRTHPSLDSVSIHPDGEHAKRFEFVAWLGRRGFQLSGSIGQTAYGGVYKSPAGKVLVINPKSGLGDVVAEWEGRSVVAECKGGIINTKHPGQTSRLRQGLCETIGLSLASTISPGRQQFAVVPKTRTTENLAQRMAGRARRAGILIALVDESGNVSEVPAN